ncbi:MAG: hypothetical protein K6C09_08655 [Oscillospiraceae bacterium]|nr:hypothetical protein [Oscillospiraceae bacterium]
MKVTPYLIIRSELQAQGFMPTKGKSILYKRTEDIIGLFCFSYPYGNVQLHFAIMPLFLPSSGNIVLTYGNRIDRIYSGLPNVNKQSSKQEIELYSNQILYQIEKDIIPLMSLLSTAASLFDYSKQGTQFMGRRFFKQIFCTKDHLYRLLFFSSLYLNDYEIAQKTAVKYERMILKEKYYTQELKNKWLNEWHLYTNLITEGKIETIQQLLQENERKNMFLFQPEKR